ncbi:GxxExxY protein [Pedobacter nototheniae]|uniref:GxxExxY protein n=1 Tax=Pedobacter nototheniae TaxID=2488994 RepID=UPI00103E0ABF|nr:GxxExxY protein [Pedobacter nototheniae]
MDRVTLKNLVYKVNGAAIEVHKSLGPGLLESVYHKCLKHELTIREVGFKSEMLVPVYYKDLLIETELYCDLFIEGYLVVELKAIEKVLPIHEAQLLTYMKLLSAPMGLMINFNCLNIFEAGQRTYVNEFYRYLH